MHYYERNIGDYYRKAGRLNIIQHGVYTLLIDACYDREQFPTSIEDAIDWVWAETKAEIKAVEFVLKKFFKLEDGFYVQNHIREDLEKFWAYGDTDTNNSEAVKEGNKDRQKRCREERQQIFAQLKQYGITPKFNAKMTELREILNDVMRKNVVTADNVTVTASHNSVTANVTAKPITINQETINQETKEDKSIGETSSPDVSVQADSEIPVEVKKQSKPKAQKFDPLTMTLPNHIDFEVWKGFVEMRNFVKKPMTEYAADQILNKLDDMGRDKNEKPKKGEKARLIFPTLANTALNNSTVKNWLDVFEPKDETQSISSGHKTLPRQQEPYKPRFGGMYQAAMDEHYQNQQPLDDNMVINGECRNV